MAEAGAVLTTIGGIAFAMGSFAHGTLAWFGTSDAMSPEAGTSLLAYVEDTPERVMVVVMAGFALYTLGSLVLAASWIRAHVTPRWIAVAFIVLTVAQFTPVPERVLDFIQVGLMALLIGVSGLVMTHRFTANL